TVEYTEGTYPAVTSAPFAVTIKPGAEPVDVRVLDYSPDQPTDTGTIKVGEEIFLTPEAQFKDDPHRWVDISDYPEPPLKWDFVADATEPGAVVKPITMGKVKGETAGKGTVTATLDRDGFAEKIGSFKLTITPVKSDVQAFSGDGDEDPHAVQLLIADAPGGELTVNWGDGTPPEAVTGSGPHAHTYAKPGDYVATVKDAAGNEVTQELFTVTSPPKAPAKTTRSSRKKS